MSIRVVSSSIIIRSNTLDENRLLSFVFQSFHLKILFTKVSALMNSFNDIKKKGKDIFDTAIELEAQRYLILVNRHKNIIERLSSWILANWFFVLTETGKNETVNLIRCKAHKYVTTV